MKKSGFGCVIDSSVILDFYQLRILNLLVGFPHSLITLDLMVFDLETPTMAEISQAGILTAETPVEVMIKMSGLSEKYRVSVFDAALLCHAKLSGMTLLSGDKTLRRAAQKEKVPVKGTLWALEKLVENSTLAPDKAVLVLERMFLLGRRLPPDEACSKILKWEPKDA